MQQTEIPEIAISMPRPDVVEITLPPGFLETLNNEQLDALGRMVAGYLKQRIMQNELR